MAIHTNTKKILVILKNIFSVLFVLGICVSFFFLPYYYSDRTIAWSLVWHIEKETAPFIAALQFTFAFFIIFFYVYLLRFQRILRHEQEELASAITNLDVGFYRESCRDKGHFLEVNDGLLKMLEYEQDELFKLTPTEICSDQDAYNKFKDNLLKSGLLIKEFVFKNKSFQDVWVLVSGKAIKDENGQVMYFEYIVMDISERKWIEEEMRSAYLRFEAVIQNTPNIAIQGMSLNGKILEWNHASEIIYGYSKSEVVGKNIELILSDDESKKEMAAILAKIKETGEAASVKEWKVKNKRGKIFTVLSSLFPIMQKGEVIEFYRMDVDISDRVDAELRLNEIKDKLEGLALKDTLTEIYNFRYFRERLTSEFDRAKRTLSPISILMIDIDYFKSINDSYGHKQGDRVLRQMARLLKTELRMNDVVARWGGEEFAIILSDTNRTDAVGVAEKILDACRVRSFGDSSSIIKLKCSIGVVSYPEDPVFSVEEIIDAAEENIYKVKERGGNGVSVYGNELAQTSFVSDTEEDRRRYVEAVKQKLSFYAVRSERSILEAIYSLAKSLELRDRRTKEHCDRMVEYAEKIAEKIGMNSYEVDNVRRAAMLHDIGKIGISDAILQKPAKLTEEEFTIVKRHPIIGADIVSVAGFLRDIVPLILSHHERFDGTGYPRGLKGEEIPLGARIVAVVDVFEALTSDRPYHKAISKEEAIKIIKQGSGTQFDENIVSIFLEIL